MPEQLPLFYKKVVPLSKKNHSHLYIEPISGYGFARESNSVYIAAVEFPRAATEYPIVFGKDSQGAVFPVALLGMKKGQNLFVNSKGEWKARYIPAYARRYPFILATPAGSSGQFTVCIDEGYSGFNTAKEGQPLFDDKGNETQILKQAVDFLKDYQTHVQFTSNFCKSLSDLNLLEPMQANVQMKDGAKYAVGGFLCVQREKLKALSAKKVTDLMKSDHMELIYAHLLSLGNVAGLTTMLTSDTTAN